MPASVMYHEGNRQLQDRFDSRRISDRLEEKLTHQEFTPEDKKFIEGLPYFFLVVRFQHSYPISAGAFTNVGIKGPLAKY